MFTDLNALQPTKRFTNRVENYVKYRPSYPEAVITFFEDHFGLRKEQSIADIGSGTGLFAEPLLKRGYGVTCIEPNEEMRRAGEKQLGGYTGFYSRGDRAEDTGLPDQSVDLITVAQAFHWMEPLATRKEFLRILKPGGHIALAWNIRLMNTSFLKAYEALKQEFGIDYQAVHRADEEAMAAFYAPMKMKEQGFPNIQMLDFDGLKGQLLSASYIPLPGHASYQTMIDTLVQLFVQHNRNGFIRMEYETKLYWNEQAF